MSPALDLRALPDAPILPVPRRSRWAIVFQRKRLFNLSIAVALLLIVGFGAAIRIWTTCTYTREGQDEHLYAVYVNIIQPSGGLSHYRKIIAADVEFQKSWSEAFVPATRIGFIWPAYFCFKTFNVNPLLALRIVSCASGILLLILAAAIGWQGGGRMGMVGLGALMSTAPLHVYLAQRSLIDAYFAFWAVLVLWLMWQNLRNNSHWMWLLAYGVSLTLLVLTKESATFVFLALLGILLLSRPLQFGKPSYALVAVTFVAPAVAVGILCALMGGVHEFISFFKLFASKNQISDYSVTAQDGPWFRYLIDFTLISPLVVVLAIAAIFQLRPRDRLTAFMAIFLGFSFATMSCVQHGMSLRYAAYWDVPLRWLALTQVVSLSGRFRKINPAVIVAGIICLVCATDLWQYHLYFVKSQIYDPITNNLVHAAGLTKKLPADRPR
jgi:hypothetical protein